MGVGGRLFPAEPPQNLSIVRGLRPGGPCRRARDSDAPVPIPVLRSRGYAGRNLEHPFGLPDSLGKPLASLPSCPLSATGI